MHGSVVLYRLLVLDIRDGDRIYIVMIGNEGRSQVTKASLSHSTLTEYQVWINTDRRFSGLPSAGGICFGPLFKH